MFSSSHKYASGNLRSVFVIDLVVLHASFLGYYFCVVGGRTIPAGAFMLMALGAVSWFLIAINSGILRIGGRVSFYYLLREIFIAFSVLTAVIIAAVAIFDEFEPNNKLILFPLLISFCTLIKRTFDILFSACVLLVLSPLFLAVACWIRITSPGPVFFKQKRIGANNREFEMFKFRSMRVQAETDSDKVWTTANDARVTGIGKFMRRSNLDELPQFWNVLTGDMSVVGPRPERGHFVERFRKEIPHYKVRHLVKSGITGWAQVNGWRGDTSIVRRVEHDIYYLENWSFWFDLKIIWLTVFGRDTRKNAY